MELKLTKEEIASVMRLIAEKIIEDKTAGGPQIALLCAVLKKLSTARPNVEPNTDSSS